MLVSRISVNGLDGEDSSWTSSNPPRGYSIYLISPGDCWWNPESWGNCGGEMTSPMIHRSRHILREPRNGKSWNVGWVSSGCYGHLRLKGQKKTSSVQWYHCSASGLVPPVNSNNGWIDGPNMMDNVARMCLRLFNGSANELTKHHNRKYCKRTSVIIRYPPSLIRVHCHFRLTPSADEGTEGTTCSTVSSPRSSSGGGAF